MTDMMLATTGNGTSIHFGMNHLCLSHNKLYTLEHIGECNRLRNCSDIQRYALRLKKEHILDWEKEERHNAIDSFVKLTLQIHNLAAQKQITLV